MTQTESRAVERASAQPFAVYNSLPEYLDHVEWPGALPTNIDVAWAGATPSEVVEICRRGDLEAVPDAAARADMINDAVDIAGRVPSWRLDVAGPFVCVPEFLAGSPECMYSPTEDITTAAPLDVCICLGACGGVSNESMRRRGVAVLAALLALSRVRDVRPYVFGRLAMTHSLIKLSQPFDVSEMCAVLTRPAFYRALMVYESMHAAEGLRGFKILSVNAWAANWSKTTEGCRRALVDLGGMPPDCLVINTETAANWANLSDAEYIEHINRMIEQARGGGFVEA